MESSLPAHLITLVMLCIQRERERGWRVRGDVEGERVRDRERGWKVEGEGER